jgi:hypothetical protein
MTTPELDYITIKGFKSIVSVEKLTPRGADGNVAAYVLPPLGA